MFRKVKSKAKVRRRTYEEEDDGEVDDDPQDRIRATQKKQKILASLPMAADGNHKKKSRFGSHNNQEEEEEDKANLTVLEQKHKQAMEAYIESNLSPSANAASKPAEATAAPKETLDPERALYQELAAATVPSQILNQVEVNEAKGAMLVGGTGIAEVILPKKTNTASAVPSGIRYSRNPNLSSAIDMSGQQEKNQRDHQAEAPLPSAGFRSMVNQNSTTTTEEEGRRPQQEETNETADPAPPQQQQPDDDRPGFDALYHPKTTADAKPKQDKPRGQQFNKDHEAFSKFVKKQRETGFR